MVPLVFNLRRASRSARGEESGFNTRRLRRGVEEKLAHRAEIPCREVDSRDAPVCILRALAGDAPKETWSGAPHSGDVEWVAWSPDGRRFATLGAEGTVLVWDAP